MKLGAAFLADAAMAVPDGTFMVWRGGITNSAVASFPAPVKYSLVVRLEAEPDEVVGKLNELTIDGTHDGSSIGTVRLPVAIPEVPGQKRYYLNFVVDLVFIARRPGEGMIQLAIAGKSLPLIHFEIVQGTGPLFPPPPKTP